MRSWEALAVLSMVELMATKMYGEGLLGNPQLKLLPILTIKPQVSFLINRDLIQQAFGTIPEQDRQHTGIDGGWLLFYWG